MAHFAELDENNVVQRVLVVSNHVIADSDGNDDEQKGIDHLQGIFGESTVWKQTSYSGSSRKNYAGAGFTYDESLDAFISPKPFPSWILDNESAGWKAPVDYPIARDDWTDENLHLWNESTTSWVLSTEK